VKRPRFFIFNRVDLFYIPWTLDWYNKLIAVEKSQPEQAEKQSEAKL